MVCGVFGSLQTCPVQCFASYFNTFGVMLAYTIVEVTRDAPSIRAPVRQGIIYTPLNIGRNDN